MDETGEWIRTGPNVIANRTRYIINDFTTEPGYTERPYVVDYPYFRSYLEVPLVSPLGYLLGSYCVVHNDLYPDFDKDETVETMNEIASAIMAHLDLRRMQQSRHRSEQLMEGLSGFIRHEPATQLPSRTNDGSETAQNKDGPPSAAAEQAADLARWVNADGPHWKEITIGTDVGEYSERPPLNHASSSVESTDSVTCLTKKDAETPPTTPRDEIDEGPMAQVAQAILTGHDVEQVDGTSPIPLGSASDTTELPANGFSSSANIKSTLFRAAATIRRSMNMDGLMFLDAVPRAYTDRSDQLELSDDRDTSQEEVVGPFCAAIVQSAIASTGEAVLQSSHTRLPEAVLQRFIRRFPQGHVFSADEFGPIDESYAPGKPFPAGRKSHGDNLRLRNDVSTLFRCLPVAKYIIFLPLWHFQQECWYTAALGWVADPTRAIEVADLSLVSAFGNSVMAEVSRLEALAASRAKSDFVSSISHELRSPLHGIMASSELLRENISDPSMLSTLDMLDSCSTTLLDIFNNLLEHATVTSSGGRYQTIMGDLMMTDLAGLVEDVVNVVYTSHLSETAFQSAEQGKVLAYGAGHSEARKELPRHPLLVTLNIESRSSWRLPVNLGACKRIVMNIFSNALKYTTAGRIQVNLKEVQRVDLSGELCDYISFSVEDTGQGMSSDYLMYKLFMPFSQENVHSPGMGLGLSIVQQLAKGLDGTVDIKSSVGVGTLVEVLAPLKQDVLDYAFVPQSPDHEQAPYAEYRDQLYGLTACLITPEAYIAITSVDCKVTREMRKRSTIVERALRVNAGTSLGMNVILGTLDCPRPKADVYILDSCTLSDTSAGIEALVPIEPLRLSPLVLLCSGTGPPSGLKQEDIKRHNIHLHHPIGPRKLASVLSSALKCDSQGTNNVEGVDPEVCRPTEDALFSSVLPQRREGLEAIQMPSQDLPALKGTLTAPEAPLMHIPPNPPSKTYHLLLVDDNPINIKLLATVVGRLKHTFATASHGLEAVQVYQRSLERREQQQPFDMIFMDISMPVMDGFEATRQIRQLESEKGVSGCKIVALTGLSSEMSRKEAFASGSDVFLTKPVKLDKVRRLLSEELDQRD